MFNVEIFKNPLFFGKSNGNRIKVLTVRKSSHAASLGRVYTATGTDRDS